MPRRPSIDVLARRLLRAHKAAARAADLREDLTLRMREEQRVAVDVPRLGGVSLVLAAEREILDVDATKARLAEYAAKLGADAVAPTKKITTTPTVRVVPLPAAGASTR